jgi:hypothetical protein
MVRSITSSSFQTCAATTSAAIHKGEEAAHEIGRVIHGYLANGGKIVEKF